MSDIRIATWNTLNAMGDERARGALEVVKWMDADVLALQEFTARDEVEGEHSLASQEVLRGLGYIASSMTDYSPYADERNMHTMSLWSRVNEPGDVRRELFGDRYAFSTEVSDFGEVIAVHLPDDSPSKRVRAAMDIVKRAGLVAILGDLNDMDRNDPRSRFPRFVDQLVRNIPVEDYYDTSRKFRRMLGQAQRIGGMAHGRAMRVFTEGGFMDADQTHEPTIGSWPLAYQIDHILVRSDVKVKSSAVLPRGLQEDSRLISDHSPVVARIKL